MTLKANYHTHTYRCGHALDEDEDYVEGAIAKGIKILGFSDHVPLKGIVAPRMRQDISFLEDYKHSILSLKEKYKDKIKIYIGYEAEYIEEYLDFYRHLLIDEGIDYLICGNHCYIENNEQVFYNFFYNNKEMVTKYVDGIIKAMESGLFIYIAHPDLFMNGYRIWDDFALEQSQRIFKASQKYNIPLEINVAGIRFAEHKHKKNKEGRPIENLYPYDEFWKEASKYKIKGIIGIDAHRKNDFLDGCDEEAIEFAKKYNIDLIEELNMEEYKKWK